jgi:phosphoribosylamine---glycine ligase
VLGGGGREHALCWALDRSASVDDVLCAPGNAGIEAVARTAALDPTDTAAVRDLALSEQVGLVVVGPEAPLVAGVVDVLQEAGVAVFGPTSAAARIEGSKAFAKEIMDAAGVPTAGYWTGQDAAEARTALDGFAPPYVVKADGLAAGKGVRICADRAEAEEAIDAALVEGAFGEAGSRVVIEEFLDGPELSLFGICDGETVLPLVPARTTSGRWTATWDPTPVAWVRTRRSRRRRVARGRNPCRCARAGPRRARPAGHALQRRALRGPRPDGGRAQGARVQRALR